MRLRNTGARTGRAIIHNMICYACGVSFAVERKGSPKPPESKCSDCKRSR